MIIKMLGIERFSYNQMFIPGFFNFHDSCSNIFPIWFYHWWIWFGCAPVMLPPEANEGWDYWSKATTTMEPYIKEVQFFKQFNVAWIFC